MALFFDLVTGFPATVESNLLQIVGGDGGFGDTAVAGDPTVQQVTYSPTTSGFGQGLINSLANSAFANPTVITGVDSNFTIGGQPITDFAGVTMCDGTVIRVVYDTSQCGGNFYHVFDNGGNQIDFRTFVILGHELSHALHISQNFANNCPSALTPAQAAAEEVRAEGDENSLRSQNGQALRDVNNHNGGCGFTGTGTLNGGCFIVTAAFGSPQASQVNYLNRFRDVILRSSAFGNEFVARLFAEYYQFSPRVSIDMNKSPALKAIISKLMVEPLIDFCKILEQYINGGWQREDFNDNVEHVLRRFAASLAEFGIHQDQIKLISQAVSKLKTRLDGFDSERMRDAPPVPPEVIDVDLVLNYLAGVVEASAPNTEYTSWTLLGPLTLFWSALAQLNDSQPQRSNVGSYLINAIEQWLGAAPIPPIFDWLNQDAVADTLTHLADNVFTVPSARRKLGTRIIEKYDGIVTYDLKAILEKVGYSPN